MSTKFKVKEGSHYVGTKKFKKGDVIVSDEPLDKIFVNKFENLGETQAAVTVDPNQRPKPKKVKKAPKEKDWDEGEDGKT